MNTSPVSVSPQRVHALRSQGKAVELIDVREPAEYRAGHASGARLIPLDELKPENLPPQLQHPGAGHDEPFYLICRSGFRAGQGAERLMEAGYGNVALVEGGTEAWEKAGLPMQRCGNALSLERQVQIAIGVLLMAKVLLGFTLHELFFAATAMIGAGLIVAGTTRWCGMSRLVALMPWNQKANCLEEATASR